MGRAARGDALHEGAREGRDAGNKGGRATAVGVGRRVGSPAACIVRVVLRRPLLPPLCVGCRRRRRGAPPCVGRACRDCGPRGGRRPPSAHERRQHLRRPSRLATMERALTDRQPRDNPPPPDGDADAVFSSKRAPPPPPAPRAVAGRRSGGRAGDASVPARATRPFPSRRRPAGTGPPAPRGRGGTWRTPLRGGERQGRGERVARRRRRRGGGLRRGRGGTTPRERTERRRGRGDGAVEAAPERATATGVEGSRGQPRAVADGAGRKAGLRGSGREWRLRALPPRRARGRDPPGLRCRGQGEASDRQRVSLALCLRGDLFPRRARFKSITLS